MAGGGVVACAVLELGLRVLGCRWCSNGSAGQRELYLNTARSVWGRREAREASPGSNGSGGGEAGRTREGGAAPAL